MLSMKSRNQLLEELIRKNGGYHLKSKKQKSVLLDQYCKITDQNRKYVIRKLRFGSWVFQERRKKEKRQRKRKSFYNNIIKSALIKCWDIFDKPCGQRLQPLLKTEIDRLIKFNSINCSSETASKLKKISARSIDTLLKSHKEKENFKRKYDYKNNPLLYQKIPTKLSSDWNRFETGNIQIDLVEHCGNSNYGPFIRTLSTTDITTGWWEGMAQLNKGMAITVENLKKIREQYPFDWKEIHSDNGSEFINAHLFKFAKQENISFSRSRPYHKNDNCFVEQKNSTHVRRCVGHLRYDTNQELKLLNNLYGTKLRLFKNFFQPIIKLISKERLGGHIKRKYDKPKTPYQRVLENRKVSKFRKLELQKIYSSLNPAQLKNDIDNILKLLKQLYDKKHSTSKVVNIKKSNNNSVTFLNCTTNNVSVT